MGYCLSSLLLIYILKVCKYLQDGAATAPSGLSVKLPTIQAGGTTEDWNYFTARWNEYVTATNIGGTTQAIQLLLECCEEGLRRELTRSNGGSLANKSFKDVEKAIKNLAIREENIMLSRVQLCNMKQDHSDTAREFGMFSMKILW